PALAKSLHSLVLDEGQTHFQDLVPGLLPVEALNLRTLSLNLTPRFKARGLLPLVKMMPNLEKLVLKPKKWVRHDWIGIRHDWKTDYAEVEFFLKRAVSVKE